MDKDLLIQNILKYCTAAQEPPTKACVNAGVGKDLPQNIRLGKKTELWRIVDLAAYLGVSTSDLVGDVPESGTASLSEDEKKLLEYYQELNEEGREDLLKQAGVMVASGMYLKKDRPSGMEKKIVE